MKKQSSHTIRQLVRKHYGKVAVGSGCGCGTDPNAGCCSSGVQISDSIGKEICAFANSRGGKIVVGVTDVARVGEVDVEGDRGDVW